MPEAWPLLLPSARPGVGDGKVDALVTISVDPSARVLVTVIMVVWRGGSLSVEEADEGGSVDDGVSPDEVVSAGGSDDDEEVVAGGFEELEEVVVAGGGVVDVRVDVEVVVGFVGVVVVFGGGAVLVVDVVAAALGPSSSSCLCWIAFPSRATALGLMNVASATDMAESPKTRSSSALLSCIVTDFVARRGSDDDGGLVPASDARQTASKERLDPKRRFLLHCWYDVSRSGNRPG
jgi:hypothetical protein